MSITYYSSTDKRKRWDKQYKKYTIQESESEKWLQNCPRSGKSATYKIPFEMTQL